MRDGHSVSGWINTRCLIKTNGNVEFCKAYRENIRYNYGRWFDLPKGKKHVIRFESTYPVDLFVVSDEGKSTYEYAIKHSGQMTSYWRQRSTTKVEFTWNPPDDRQYWIIVDNTVSRRSSSGAFDRLENGVAPRGAQGRGRSESAGGEECHIARLSAAG